MKISAALAADLGILSAALDEPAADVLHSLHHLGVDAQAAVPTFLGLSVTVAGRDPPFTFTTFDGDAADDVGASLWLTLPGAGAGWASPSVALILYARRPGTFVDLAADLAWLTGRPPSDFALDQHLCGPAGSDIGASLRAASVINQAIGVLICRGYTPRQAHSKLATQADGASTDRYATAQSILDTLTPRPRSMTSADQKPKSGMRPAAGPCPRSHG